MRFAITLFCVAAALPADSVAGVKGQAPMRAATYTVQDAECVVYFFGQGQGGSVEANIARWGGQFTRNGQPAQSKFGQFVESFQKE